MKKFYTLFLALICAITAAAAPASQLYLIGEPAGGWSPRKGTAMKQTSTGVFELDVTLTANKWFGFSAKLGSSASDWSTMNSARYGAPTNNYTIAVGETVKLSYPSENSFQLGKGEYHFKVDTNNNTFTLTGKEEEDPTANIMYLRGAVSGWNATDTYKFAQEGNTYTLHLDALFGEFKIANSDYSQQFATATPIVSGTAYSVSNLGMTNCKLADEQLSDVDITFVKTDKTSGTLTITGKKKGIETLYIHGTVLDVNFDPSKGVEMTKTADGIFTAEGVEIGHALGTDFGYCSFSEKLGATWDVVKTGVRFGAEKADFVPTMGQAATLVQAVDPNAFKLASGKYNFSVDISDTNSAKVTITSADEPNGGTIYVVGLVDGAVGHNANCTSPLAETETAGVYAGRVNFFGQSSQTSIFRFCEKNEATSYNDWEGCGTIWGASTAGEKIVFNKEYTLNTTTDGSSPNTWQVACGTYDVTVDLNTMTMVITNLDNHPVGSFTFTNPDLFPANANRNEDEWTVDGTTANKYFPVAGIEMLDGVVGLTCEQGTATDTPRLYVINSTTKSYALRTYNGNTFTITVPEGNALTRVEIKAERATYLKIALGDDQPGNFKIPVSSAIAYWTAPEAPAARAALEPVRSLTFKGTGTSRIQYINVLLTEGNTTGLESIDAVTAEPVYYNLHGIRVANPEAGQLYIVKRGEKVTKEIAR